MTIKIRIYGGEKKVSSASGAGKIENNTKKKGIIDVSAFRNRQAWEKKTDLEAS